MSGLISGKIADRSGPRVLQVVGPIIAGAGCLGIVFVKMTTSLAAPMVLLFIVGVGVGIYNSPNSMAGMLAVLPQFRGVASGFQTMVLMFGQILSLITLFGILTHSVDFATLFDVFLYGGGGSNMEPVLSALHKCYIVATILFWASVVVHGILNTYYYFVEKNGGVKQGGAPTPAPALAPTAPVELNKVAVVKA